MKIEHIAMYVNDLEATRDFFATFLASCSARRFLFPAHNKDDSWFSRGIWSIVCQTEPEGVLMTG